MSVGERRALIEPGHPELSLSRQCHLLGVSRSSLYHEPKGESEENRALMRRIDELFLECPFYGSRQMARHLRREGIRVGRHRVRRLMRLMGLEAIYQAPRTTRPHPEHRVYPYLLKGVAIERPNQVWCADVTYIPVQKGFLYLVAVMDWASRQVLSWRLSNTLDARFCTDALKDALERYGRPEIFNSDQGSQFTSLEFTSVLKDSGVAISMDGRGRCMDNIFIERLWRSLKYEAVYLHELSDGFQAQRLISNWFAFYNTQRPHSALAGNTPAEAYLHALPHRTQPPRSSEPPPAGNTQNPGVAGAARESRRYAPPPLRSGPPGDSLPAPAQEHLWPEAGFRPSVRPPLDYPQPAEGTLPDPVESTMPPTGPSGPLPSSPSRPVQPQPHDVLNRTLAA